MVVDDYGHHPTEIAAVLAAARPASTGGCASSSSRTGTRGRRTCSTSSARARRGRRGRAHRHLRRGRGADRGRDRRGAGGGRQGVGHDARSRRPSLDDVPAAVAGIARPGDMVITLGAGSIGSVGERVLLALDRASRPDRASEGDRP
jgi:UDP-N-acetylmuramate--alanine ligase